MRSYDLTGIWVTLLIDIGVAIWLLYVVIGKKRIIKWEKATGINRGNQASLKKHDKRNNIGLKIFLVICLAIYTIACIPYYKDLPSIISGKYTELHGVVTEDQKGLNSKRGFFKTYVVFIMDDYSDEVLRIEISDVGLNKDDKVYIKYLPNSKQGSLIRYSRAGRDTWHDM